VDGDTVFLRGRRGIAVRDAVDGEAVFLLGRLGTAVRDAVDGDTVFLLGRLGITARDGVDGDTVLLRGLLGAAVRDIVVGNTVFSLGRLEIAARDLVDGATVLGSVDATDTRLGVAAGDDSTGVGVDKTVGDNTGCTVPTGAVNACTCTTASSGGLFWPVSVTTSNRKRC